MFKTIGKSKLDKGCYTSLSKRIQWKKLERYLFYVSSVFTLYLHWGSVGQLPGKLVLLLLLRFWGENAWERRNQDKTGGDVLKWTNKEKVRDHFYNCCHHNLVWYCWEQSDWSPQLHLCNFCQQKHTQMWPLLNVSKLFLTFTNQSYWDDIAKHNMQFFSTTEI